MIVLVSGGLDSSTLLYKAVTDQTADKVRALTIDYGQRHVRELTAAGAICDLLDVKHTVVDLRWLKHALKRSALMGGQEVPHGHYTDSNMAATVVPNRNGILLSVAIAVAIDHGHDTVAYAAHSGDHAIYPDCRPEFVESMRQVAMTCHYDPLYLWTPFIDIDKAAIVKLGLELGVPFEQTWTCYEGKGTPCGKCGACVERAEAFAANNTKDPLLGGR